MICNMSSSGQNTGGLMSSSGLVRYFDEDEASGVKINPATALSVSVFVGFCLHLVTAVM